MTVEERLTLKNFFGRITAVALHSENVILKINFIWLQKGSESRLFLSGASFWSFLFNQFSPNLA